MFYAIAIIFNSFQYLFNSKTKYYCLAVFFASLFHYSALFMLLFLPLSFNEKDIRKNIKKVFFLIVLLFPVLILLVSFIANKFLGSRYAGYSQIYEYQFSISSITLLPIFLYCYWRRSIIPAKFKHKYLICLLLLLLSSVVTIYSSFISLGRLIFYMNLSLILLLPAIYRYEKRSFMKLLCFCLIIVYSFLYLFVSQFYIDLNAEYLLPYKNIYFII